MAGPTPHSGDLLREPDLPGVRADASAAPAPQAAAPLPPPRERYLNRELSWLDFDARVLALAEDASQPLLERTRFLAIFSRNLDEFFQVRVAGLKAQAEAGLGATSPDTRTPEEQLYEIRVRVEELVRRAGDLYAKELLPGLAEQGIRICDWSALEPGERQHLGQVFEDEIFPILTPLAVDPAHPFPYISSLSLNLAVLVRDPVEEVHRFARVKVPPLLPRLLPLPGGRRFVPVEQVVAAHLHALFPGMEILSNHAFRVTRDADIAVEEDEAEDLLAAMESVLRRRQRGSNAVRLEVDASIHEEVCDLLSSELELEPQDVYRVSGPLDFTGLGRLYRLERSDLKDPPWVPQTPRALAVENEPDFFELLKEGDILVHHPYDSFSTSVQAFLEQAAGDRRVLAIKHTLYRTTHEAENPIVDTLVRAAESGKQVVTLVELKARFDEQANIDWARTLEQAGVHVVYGLVGLKTHAKVALVVRREQGRIRRYCHVGTGNYNPSTATLYEDLGLLTADEDVGADLSELFNYLTGVSRPHHYRKVLVAPETLRPALLALIRAEAAAGDGEIVLKVNALQDPEIIDALYEASRAGVAIDLVVRGICCLRAGVPGLSENIRVRSILGRFLEHSRIYRFGSRARGRRYFLGSGDLMKRKLDHRVEAVIPVDDPALQARLEEILELALADDGLAWVQRPAGPDGADAAALDSLPVARVEWVRVPSSRNLRLQDRLQELARRRADPGRETGG